MTSAEPRTTIRAAAEPDAPRLAELLAQLGYPVAAAEVRERLRYWLPDPMSRVLVAERNGVVLGGPAGRRLGLHCRGGD